MDSLGFTLCHTFSLGLTGTHLDSLRCHVVSLGLTLGLTSMSLRFHPEFTSTPREGHPLFSKFISAAIDNKNKVDKGVAANEVI